MAAYYYPVVFEPEDKGYSAFVPDLPGCMTQGESLAETLEMLQEAMGLSLEGLEGKDFPQASAPEDIVVKKQQFLMMIEFDKNAYDKKYNTKAIKKTLSIPAWLNRLAEEQHINFSHLLQAALKERLHVEG